MKHGEDSGRGRTRFGLPVPVEHDDPGRRRRLPGDADDVRLLALILVVVVPPELQAGEPPPTLARLAVLRDPGMAHEEQPP